MLSRSALSLPPLRGDDGATLDELTLPCDRVRFDAMARSLNIDKITKTYEE